MYLDRLINNAAGRFGGVEFGLACLTTDTAGARIFQVCSAVNQKSGGVEFGNHVG